MKSQAAALHLNNVNQRAIVPRSKINNNFEHRTTFQHGKLVPIYCQQALPGAQYNINLKSFIRLATPLTATMDNLVCDTYFFFVPNRIIFTNFEKFMGINDDGNWNVSSLPAGPILKGNSLSNLPKYNESDVASYLGLWPQGLGLPPFSDGTMAPSYLPLAAYMQIWNDHFRDPNFDSTIPFKKDGTNPSVGARPSTGTLWKTSIQQGYGLAPVCKNRDLFTTCYQAPQKGESTLIPMNDTFLSNISNSSSGSPSHLVEHKDLTLGNTKMPSSLAFGSSTSFAEGSYSYTNAGIYASDAAGTINQLREAFAIQSYLENDMNNRYKDSLLSHFGVSNNDDVLQRAQFLGGNRFLVNMNSVVQNTSATATTSEGDDYTTPAGYVAGYSATYDDNTKISFDCNEHGWLIGLVVTRIKKHSYSQGINPQFNINSRYDIYSPEFANLPYQPVMKKTIMAGSTGVFGYAPAWWQYRERFDLNSGYFATQNPETLDYWHYGDYYASAPTLSSNFLYEESYQLDRTIAIASDKKHPYIGDFFFDEVDILPMPLYSRPGLPFRA